MSQTCNDYDIFLLRNHTRLFFAKPEKKVKIEKRARKTNFFIHEYLICVKVYINNLNKYKN